MCECERVRERLNGLRVMTQKRMDEAKETGWSHVADRVCTSECVSITLTYMYER